MKCGKCGYEMPEGVKYQFCPNCAYRIREGDVPVGISPNDQVANLINLALSDPVTRVQVANLISNVAKKIGFRIGL